MATIQNLIRQGIDLLNAPLLKFGDTTVSLVSVVYLVFSLLAVIFVSRLLKNFLKDRLLAKLGIDEGNRESISTIVSYSVGTFGCIIVLQAIGFNLTSLAVLAGGLGVGIGFGLQNLTKNFISGLTILVEGTVKASDYVEFEGLSGYVKSISLRSTLIRTFDGGYVIVPNSNMVENPILNWSYNTFKDARRRLKIRIGVSYDTDPVLVTETLLNSAYMETSIMYDPPPRVVFIGFADYTLEFELWAWIAEVDSRITITSSLNYIIEYNLRQQGIKLPIPQRDFALRNAPMPDQAGLTSLMVTVAESQPLPQLAVSEETVAPVAKPISLRELLRKITYFQNFNDLQLRQLIEIGHRQRLSAGEILFREDDPGDAFYVVLSGEVEVYVEKINKFLTTLGPGKFLGELALMLGIPRTASVKAVAETILFVVGKSGFEKLLREHPEISEVIIQELSKHQEELTQRQQQLRAMGLVDESEDDNNPVNWVRKRLKNLFSL